MWGRPTLRDTPVRGFFSIPPEVGRLQQGSQDVDRYTAGLTATHRPASWLTQRLIAGVDQTAEDNSWLIPFPDDYARQFLFPDQREGKILIDRRLLTVSTVDYGITAVGRLGARFGSTSSIGGQYYRNFVRSQYSEGRGFPAPGVQTVTAAAQQFGGSGFVENVTLGVYLQQQFSLNDRLFLTAGLRADDNSAFGEGFELVKYPKVSGAWVISDEPFWKLGFVDALKLRAAYGQSGQQPQSFAALRTFRPTTAAGGSGITPDALGNPDLGPERGEEIELGFEGSLGNGRIGLDFTFYRKRTKNAILLREVAPSTGFPSVQFVNAGEVRNRGLELLLTLKPLQGRTLKWDVNLSLSHNSNEVVDLDPNNPSLTFISIGTQQRHAEGHPVGGLFAKRIVSAAFNSTTGRSENVLCDGGTGAQPLPCAQAPFLYMGDPIPSTKAR